MLVTGCVFLSGGILGKVGGWGYVWGIAIYNFTISSIKAALNHEGLVGQQKTAW